MLDTNTILQWLDTNCIWLHDRNDVLINPLISSMHVTFISVTTSFDEHMGHPRQKFPCYMECSMRVTDRQRKWSEVSRLLKTVIRHYPNAEYTFGGNCRIKMHFDKADSIALALQLGL